MICEYRTIAHWAVCVKVLLKTCGCQLVMSRYRECMAKQTTVRLPEDMADDAEAVARVRGTSVNQLIVDSLAAEIDRVRADKDFTQRAKRLLERDKELLERLAK